MSAQTKRVGPTAPKVPVPAVKDPSTFDVTAWLEDLKSAGFKPRNVLVKMHFRGDLLPRMKYLVGEIQRLQGLDDVEREGGLDDSDPLTDLVAEYTRLDAEFRDGGFLTFEFRPMNKRIQNDTYEAWKVKFPGDSTTETQEELILMRMAASCIGFPGSEKFPAPIPPEAFKAFEDAYGTPAFNTLITGFLEAYEAGGEVDAPFLPKHSPVPGTGASSND